MELLYRRLGCVIDSRCVLRRSEYTIFIDIQHSNVGDSIIKVDELATVRRSLACLYASKFQQSPYIVNFRVLRNFQIWINNKVPLFDSPVFKSLEILFIVVVSKFIQIKKR